VRDAGFSQLKQKETKPMSNPLSSFLSSVTTFLGRVFTFNQTKFDGLVADIKQDIQVAEGDLAEAAAWVVANGPTLVSDAQTLISVLGAVTGNLTIQASVIAALKTAVADAQQFIGAVSAAQSAGAGAFDGLAAFGGSNTPTIVVSGYAVHASLTQAIAAARTALANSTKTMGA
jgi:hypothetical protein